MKRNIADFKRRHHSYGIPSDPFIIPVHLPQGVWMMAANGSELPPSLETCPQTKKSPHERFFLPLPTGDTPQTLADLETQKSSPLASTWAQFCDILHLRALCGIKQKLTPDETTSLLSIFYSFSCFLYSFSTEGTPSTCSQVPVSVCFRDPHVRYPSNP